MIPVWDVLRERSDDQAVPTGVGVV